jgi:hypothetical protein
LRARCPNGNRPARIPLRYLTLRWTSRQPGLRMSQDRLGDARSGGEKAGRPEPYTRGTGRQPRRDNSLGARRPGGRGSRRVWPLVLNAGSLRTLATGDRFGRATRAATAAPRSFKRERRAPAPPHAESSARQHCPSHGAKRVPLLRSRRSLQLCVSSHAADRRSKPVQEVLTDLRPAPSAIAPLRACHRCIAECC